MQNFLGTPISSTNKTDGHDIPEILLKVALSTITPVFTTKVNSLVLGYLRMILWKISTVISIKHRILATFNIKKKSILTACMSLTTTKKQLKYCFNHLLYFACFKPATYSAYLKPGTGCSTPYVVFFLMFNELRWEVIIWFVDIDR
jgi:hypothetical protein